jgi:hypothetical protein
MTPCLHNQINQKTVRLLDSWSIHKSKEFFDWMKGKHSNTLVNFVPSNCTNVLQPTYVILQCPLKHVFRMAFNGLTINIIKSHIDTSANPNVHFKMSNLKKQLMLWMISTQHKNLQPS